MSGRRGGGDGVRPQPAQRSTVALWETQAGPDIRVLHGEVLLRPLNAASCNEGQRFLLPRIPCGGSRLQF